MSDGKIYITISDERGNGGSGPKPDSPNPSKPQEDDKNKSSLLGDYVKHQFFNLVTSQARQAVNFALSNIGNFTGDYQQQREVQNAISAGQSIYQLGLTAYMGFQTAGPVGALVGATISLASQAANFAKNEYLISFSMKKQNRDIDILRERSGLYSLNDGSRGTEN